MRILQRFGHLYHDVENLVDRQQIIRVTISRKIFALHIVHGDVSQILLLADIVYGHNIGVIKAGGGFCFPEETFFDLHEPVSFKLLRKRERLDRQYAAEFRILANVNDAHAPFGQFLLDLIAAKHRFLHTLLIQYERTRRQAGANTAQYGIVFYCFAAGQAFLYVAEPSVMGREILVDTACLVELTLAFEIEREVV